MLRTGLVFGNIAILVIVGAFIIVNHSASPTIRKSTVNSAVQTAAGSLNPLDQLSAAEIAAQAAQLVKMPELTAVRNQADSENAQLSIVPSDTSIIAKPQIVSTGQKSKKDIVKYKVAANETASSIATKFGINADSVKWSNGLVSENIAVDREIIIPPANGIAYQVKAGDTIDSLVSKYRADKVLFITVNDAESGALTVGEYVWIPNGQQPVVVRATGGSGAVGFSFGYTAIYGGNGYDYGYCTWYVANKRASIGRPVPKNLGNASTWKVLAQRAGIATGPTPQVGAVAWVKGGNHVAFVEEVYPDGSFKISEMNAVGWNRVSTQLITGAAIGRYYFIY